MKKVFILALVLNSSVLLTGLRDTTLYFDLNFDGNDEKISLRYDEEGKPFMLSINNAKAEGSFVEGYGADLQIIDMDRNDNLREVIVKGYGSSDQADMHFYQFINGKIVECGRLPGNYGVESTGNKILTEHGWMGFWGIKFKYRFDTKNKSLTFEKEDFYGVNIEATVKESFKLLKYRYDDSEVSAVLKPGTKITIVKSDITPSCNEQENYMYDMMCDWYYIKTDEGKAGWYRLDKFYEFVDGLIWAG
ncbi:MAG: hypothetical protein K8I03_07450 [Ignavibacteria bacterium]|nr:hypothetical protein [Ignavibacteria bacterium]